MANKRQKKVSKVIHAEFYGQDANVLERLHHKHHINLSSWARDTLLNEARKIVENK